jgi:hypothetical protein
MIFNCKEFKNYVHNPKILLNNKELAQVAETKYLGSIFTNTLSNSKDISRCNSAFLGQFYGMYRKFNYVDWRILKLLFESCCTCFYGSELWYDRNLTNAEFRTLGVTYHKSIKKMRRLPPWTSNHDLCEEANLPIFKHLINKKIVTFWFSLIYSKSPCIAPLINHFKHQSQIKQHIDKLFEKCYQIVNLLDNDLDAIKARINYVEAHEPRTHYVYEPPIANVPVL